MKKMPQKGKKRKRKRRRKKKEKGKEKHLKGREDRKGGQIERKDKRKVHIDRSPYGLTDSRKNRLEKFTFP